jgi:uncharacterized protein YceH (UPF0502 family)
VGRVSKYKHHAYEWLGVNKPEIAVMAELLLRGPQTLGELRSRAARMEPIADSAALRPIVDALLERGLMIELTPPGRGQIVTHRLYLEPELAVLREHAGARGGIEHDAGAAAAAAVTERGPGLAGALAELREELASLRERVAELERRLETPRE